MRKVICVLVIAASLMTASSASAALVSGNGHVFYNLGNFMYIWDVNGHYTTASRGTYFGQPAEVTYDYDIVQDDRGRVTGSGTCFVRSTDPNFVNPSSSDPNVTDPNIFVMPFTVKGTVSTRAGACHFRATFSGRGDVNDVNGVVVRFRLSKSIDALIIADSNSITGFANESISVPGNSVRNRKQMFDATLPVDMNGVATLGIDCHSNGRQIVTTAGLTFSNGNVISLAGGGSFDAKRGINSLKLKNGRNSLQVKIANEQNSNNMTLFKGKVLGQRFKFPP